MTVNADSEGSHPTLRQRPLTLYTSPELTQEPVDLCRFRGKQIPQVGPDTV